MALAVAVAAADCRRRGLGLGAALAQGVAFGVLHTMCLRGHVREEVQ